MKFYREKISNRNFSKKRGQNILKLAHNVEKYLKIWNLGVSIGDTFFWLTWPSQTVWIVLSISNKKICNCFFQEKIKKKISREFFFKKMCILELLRFFILFCCGILYNIWLKKCKGNCMFNLVTCSYTIALCIGGLKNLLIVSKSNSNSAGSFDKTRHKILCVIFKWTCTTQLNN